MMSPYLNATVPEVVEEVETTVVPALVIVAAIAGAVVLAFLGAMLVAIAGRALARRWRIPDGLAGRVRRPLRALLTVVLVWVALSLTTEPSSWTSGVEHGLTIALIVAVAWLLGQLTYVIEGMVGARYRVDVVDNRHARRVRTELQVLRRLVGAVIVLLAVAAILFTFPAMRTVGTSLLASAGLVSIIAGLAAQSSLANIFAGMQIAFGDAIRVDDVVIVDGEWGRIEEITMTYVVVHIWDDRRLILPSTYFTTTPFQNWTRRSSALLGTVEIDVDWTVPIEAMRAEMNRLLDESELWDKRARVLQVTEATGGFLQVRALASAKDAPTLFDLRCYLREGLVTWLREAQGGIPRTRLERYQAPTPPPASADAQPESSGRSPSDCRSPSDGRSPSDTAESRLFTGTQEAVDRSKAFAGPGQEVFDEREQTAERAAVVADPAPTQVIPRVPITGKRGGTHQ